jgi:hypothetical protein
MSKRKKMQAVFCINFTLSVISLEATFKNLSLLFLLVIAQDALETGAVFLKKCRQTRVTKFCEENMKHNQGKQIYLKKQMVET